MTEPQEFIIEPSSDSPEFVSLSDVLNRLAAIEATQRQILQGMVDIYQITRGTAEVFSGIQAAATQMGGPMGMIARKMMNGASNG